MIGICRHAFDPEKDEGFERTDILAVIPQKAHIVVFARARAQTPFFAFDFLGQGLYGMIVEIDVGNGGKQAF